jgi:sec-independent protein translocase protein TatA
MFDGLFANPLHWGILIIVVLIVFGPGKLPGVGASLGKSLREFKKATQEETTPTSTSTTPLLSAAASGKPETAGAVCESCGHENQAGGRFCSVCGSSLVKVADPVVTVNAAPPAQETRVADSPKPSACPTCKTENPAGNQFCAHCGKLLEAAVASRV